MRRLRRGIGRFFDEERQHKKPSPRGEGGQFAKTNWSDEGTTFPIDAGFGEAVCLPRMEKKPRALC